MNNIELQSFETKRKPLSREEMMFRLSRYIESLVSLPAPSKDLDGIEKLMRLYFEQLDKLESEEESA